MGRTERPWGQLTLGRQYGSFSDMIGAGDILGLTDGDALHNNGKGNYGSNAGETNFFSGDGCAL